MVYDISRWVDEATGQVVWRDGEWRAALQRWSAMWNRCANPNASGYGRYGGRGITVCERWGSFLNFLRDMGPPPPGMWLERINNDEGYGPDNCKWATPWEQARNRCNTRRPVDQVPPPGHTRKHKDEQWFLHLRKHKTSTPIRVVEERVNGVVCLSATGGHSASEE